MGAQDCYLTAEVALSMASAAMAAPTPAPTARPMGCWQGAQLHRGMSGGPDIQKRRGGLHHHGWCTLLLDWGRRAGQQVRLPHDWGPKERFVQGRWSMAGQAP